VQFPIASLIGVPAATVQNSDNGIMHEIRFMHPGLTCEDRISRALARRLRLPGFSSARPISG
jgi:hypothetical protein